MINSRYEVSTKKPFPCVMQGVRMIVLFYAEGCGYVIASNDLENYPVGYHSKMFNTETFKPFKGEITIEVD